MAKYFSLSFEIPQIRIFGINNSYQRDMNYRRAFFTTAHFSLCMGRWDINSRTSSLLIQTELTLNPDLNAVFLLIDRILMILRDVSHGGNPYAFIAGNVPAAFNGTGAHINTNFSIRGIRNPILNDYSFPEPDDLTVVDTVIQVGFINNNINTDGISPRTTVGDLFNLYSNNRIDLYQPTIFNPAVLLTPYSETSWNYYTSQMEMYAILPNVELWSILEFCRYYLACASINIPANNYPYSSWFFPMKSLVRVSYADNQGLMPRTYNNDLHIRAYSNYIRSGINIPRSAFNNQVQSNAITRNHVVNISNFIRDISLRRQEKIAVSMLTGVPDADDQYLNIWDQIINTPNLVILTQGYFALSNIFIDAGLANAVIGNAFDKSIQSDLFSPPPFSYASCDMGTVGSDELGADTVRYIFSIDGRGTGLQEFNNIGGILAKSIQIKDTIDTQVL